MSSVSARQTLGSTSGRLRLRPVVAPASRRRSLREGLAAAYGGYTRSGWMSDLARICPARPLRDVCLVGSHDAAMYRLTYSRGGTADTALNQNLRVYDQLRAGARFFDLRPAFAEGNVELVSDRTLFSAHFSEVRKEVWGVEVDAGVVGATGPPIREVFEDVRRFLTENSREVVVLAFRKFYPHRSPLAPGTRGDAPLLTSLRDTFLDVLGGMAVDPVRVPEPFGTPLPELLSAGRVVAYTHDQGRAQALRQIGLPVYSEDAVVMWEPYDSGTWHGADDVRAEGQRRRSDFDETAEYQLRALANGKEAGGRRRRVRETGANVYHVVQWIVRGVPVLNEYSVREMAEHMNREVPRLRAVLPGLRERNAGAERRTDQRFPNVVMADAVESGGLWEATQGVNRALSGWLR